MKTRSTKFRLTLLLVGSLCLLALGTGLFTTYSVSETLYEKTQESNRNAVSLSANNIRSRYQELFNLRVEQAMQIKASLALFERIIRGLADSADFPAMLGGLSLPEGMTVIALDDDLRLVLKNGPMPNDCDPYAVSDIKGREIGRNMMRLGKANVAATAMVQFAAPGAGRHKFFGRHFYLPGRKMLVGLWMDIEPHEAVQARNLDEAIASLRENFRQIRIGPSGFLFVADADGRVVIQPEDRDLAPVLAGNNPATGRTLIQDLREGSARPETPIPVLFPFGGGNREALVYAEGIRPLKWHVTGVGFVDEIKAPGARLSIALALGILFATCLLALVAMFVVGRLTAPLARLAEFARQLPQADFFQEQGGQGIPLSPADNRRGDEIGELSRAFLFMDGALRERVRELVETAGARERMAGELHAATEIQMGFLPKALDGEAVRGRFDLSGSLTPAREVGGDLYDFFMPDPGRLCLIVGDVSGKGVPAALFMSMTMVLVRAAAKASGPGKIMETVNAALAMENPNLMFVTLFIAFLDLSSGELVYANAGHNPPWLLGAGGSRQLDGLSGPPVGVFADREYRSFDARMRPGDTLFLYTDGVTEAMNGHDEQFGDNALEQTLSRRDGAGAESLIRLVSDALDRHVDGAPASDDITMVCLVYKGGGGM